MHASMSRTTARGELRLDTAIERTLKALLSEQNEEGAWPGDYGGPLFLLPMYMATCAGLDVEVPKDVRAEMVRYLRGVQNADGGFGLHVESHSYLFTSTINYAALRLFGVEAEDPMLKRARTFIRDQGGPVRAATWGKFLLTLLNLYDYRGLNPVPPELWILPTSLPVHPSRMWCHTRMVYLPMSYLYGHRVQRPACATVAAMRAELYDRPYERIDWAEARDQIAKSDDYRPVTKTMSAVNRVLLGYEEHASSFLRQRALGHVLDVIEAEDRNTNYICLGPVSKLYHLWVWNHARPGGLEFQRHVAQLPEYLWHGPDGVKMQGYHSSQLWDTAFAAQAIVATGQADAHQGALERANRFIDQNQVRQDLPRREAAYRDPTRGGFCFSKKDNGWTVSDCTAEGLRAALALRGHVKEPLAPKHLREAVDLILWSQNEDGGWASYEPSRGPRWLESLNPSNCFGDIMIDYSYVECTAACMIALKRFVEAFPEQGSPEIAAAIARGLAFLRKEQRPDGSFEGSWAICFTYGTLFGVEGLRAGGVAPSDPAIVRAADFLVEKQLADGGFGELAQSCLERRYVSTSEGQAVMTSWALMALLAAGRAQDPATARAVRFLIERQNTDGSYPQEHIAGMFSKTCAIHYDNYRKVFPLWALAEARAHGVRM